MLPPIASRFIAGETKADALAHARTMNEDGVNVILNLLGEHYDARAYADRDATTYRRLVEAIDDAGLGACVSVKPSQLGLNVHESVFRENLRSVVEHGQAHDVFVWVDMEDSSTTDATLDAFEELAEETGGGVGVCVQSNLRRTREDVRRLADVPGKIRLVKGAYDEPLSVAYRSQDAVNSAFRGDLTTAFKLFEDGVAVATHDPEMIEHAAALHDQYGTGYEVQMLMGVREDTQRELAASGTEVWQYAPYGDRWLSYVYRRFRERKENVEFIVRALLG